MPAEEHKQVAGILEAAYSCFRDEDAMLVEINPLIVTAEGELRALDAKVTIDDNALFRHPDIAAMRDVAAADPQEQMARERGVTYVKLDGEVGILGNGAGLVMSTLDVVAQAGGTRRELPRRRRRRAGRGDRHGARGDPLRHEGAGDPVQHLRRHHPLRRGRARDPRRARPPRRADVPIVVRLDGTSDEEGRKLLRDADPPNLTVERTMLDAARRAVELAGKAA